MKKLNKIISYSLFATIVFSNSHNAFANVNENIVKVTVGNKIANINGNDIVLDIAPYIQNPSKSIMIPLRFVSNALGINKENIQFNPNTKEITIIYKDREVKFLAGTNTMYINNEEFKMTADNPETKEKFPIFTEINQGITFIPLRALSTALDIKIDWDNTTKTAILTNNLTLPKQNIVHKSSEKINITEEERSLLEKEVVRLVNEERIKNGLNPLIVSDKLMKSAREKSDDMATTDYGSHTNPSGFNLASTLNVAENIHGGSNDAKGAFDSWMASKGHKENILNPNAKYIGVGFSYNENSKYVYYWTQHFSYDDKWAN